ncbi:MAG: hypothetical protein NT145_06850 [Elusimicrobia bacterium]|nr:hypothetical protein [Elusimicrobiota bacterium]
MKILMFVLLGLTVGAVSSVFGTPSTQIWNPSTDIQAKGTFHLGIDNYYSVTSNDTKAYASPTYVGLTYGAFKNLEIGFDVAEPSADPLFFNLKYGIHEAEKIPALAVGGFNFGGKKDVSDMNILYAITAKTFKPVGRFSLGYYSGNGKLLLDEKGEKANTGVIVSFDRYLSEKVWFAIDYASGKSVYGSLSTGVSYSFAPNTSIIFGYVMYNNTNPIINRNNQFTTQLDINF